MEAEGCRNEAGEGVGREVKFESAKSMPARSKSAGTPSEQQMAAIRPFCLSDISADQIYARQFVLAHNCIDRDDEAFDEGLAGGRAGDAIDYRQYTLQVDEVLG